MNARPSTSASGPQRHLAITRSRYRDLMDELARRGRRQRESGAVLLAPVHLVPLPGTAPSRPRRIPVTKVVYFDDLDPDCLKGNIEFSATGFDKLWSYCADRGLTVVADVHTHPGPGVAQSHIDATNPMISAVGHIAVIAPDYAVGRPPVSALGVHTHLGGFRWKSAYGSDASEVLAVRSAWTNWLDHAAHTCARAAVRLIPASWRSKR